MFIVTFLGNTEAPPIVWRICLGEAAGDRENKTNKEKEEDREEDSEEGGK